jgi:hypothetical protein
VDALPARPISGVTVIGKALWESISPASKKPPPAES